MERALDTRNVRRERRLGIAVRLVLYPMALGLIVLAWRHYHGEPGRSAPVHLTLWKGVTSQRQPISLATTDDGRVTSVAVHLLERCDRGSIYNQGWTPGLPHLVQHGEDVRGHQGGMGRTYSGLPVMFDARLWARMGARPHGTMRAQVTWTADHLTESCRSGPVTFALQRSP
jgi:hypothetical protein